MGVFLPTGNDLGNPVIDRHNLIILIIIFVINFVGEIYGWFISSSKYTRTQAMFCLIEITKLLLFISAVISKQFCVWRNQRDSSLSMATHKTSSEFDCLVICMTHSGCEAINYSKSDGLCVLGRAEDNMSAGLDTSSDTVHYSTKHVLTPV